jgi:hypothetical protein
MKSRIAIAISIGIVISVLFTALNMQLGDTPFTYLLFPGYVAIVLLWVLMVALFLNLYHRPS